MSKATSWSKRTTTIGEDAVDGVGHGLLAGLFMGAFLLAVGLARGTEPGAVLAGFSLLGEETTALSGVLTHLATSAVYGALFGVVWHLVPLAQPTVARRMAGVLMGLLYGVLLSLVATSLLDITTASLPEFEAGHLLGAHLIYGVVNGWTASGIENDGIETARTS